MIFNHCNAELATKYIGKTVINVEDKRKYILDGIKISPNKEEVFYIEGEWVTKIAVPDESDENNTIPVIEFGEIYDKDNKAMHLIGHPVLMNDNKDYIGLGHGFIGILENIRTSYTIPYGDLNEKYHSYIREIIIKSSEPKKSNKDSEGGIR